MRKIQVAVSTQNLLNDDDVDNLIKKMNIKTEYLIINQTYNSVENINNENTITKNEKGLSKSRNVAIEKATSDIILFADDDVIYNNDYERIILESWEKYKNADIICFFVESKTPKRKIKRINTGKIGYLKAMKVTSIEISIKKENIIKHNIKFDENFGAGTKYNRGEETIFLYEALRKKLNIIFVNKKIGEVEQKESTWFTEFDEEFFKIQGKVFKRMTEKYYKLLIYQYAIRKYFMYRNKISLKKAIDLLLEA